MICLMEANESGDDLGAAFLTDGAYMVHGDDLEGVYNFHNFLRFWQLDIQQEILALKFCLCIPQMTSMVIYQQKIRMMM